MDPNANGQKSFHLKKPCRKKAIKDINKTTRDLKNQQYEFKMVRSEWMFMTKQSEVVKAVEASGIREILEPPIAIQDSSVDEERKTR